MAVISNMLVHVPALNTAGFTTGEAVLAVALCVRESRAYCSGVDKYITYEVQSLAAGV